MNDHCDLGPGWRDVEHGDRCDCMLLAQAVGAPASSVDFAYCHHVLQKHWRLHCNHGGREPPARATPELPPLDAHDAVHAMLLANTPVERARLGKEGP